MATMDTITTALFEDPAWLYVALGVIEAALVALWRARPGRWAAIALPVPVVLAGAVFIVSDAVVTDRERITAAARAIARDIEAGKTDVLAEYLDDAYRGFCSTKPQAVKACDLAIARYGLRVITFRHLEVQPAGQAAQMQATTLIVPSKRRASSLPVQMTWNVRWAKRPQGWRIVAAIAIRR